MSYRNVEDVIPQILAVIPKNETRLINELQKHYDEELWNKAPELRSCLECWAPLQAILMKHINDTRVDWQKNVVDIYNGTKSDAEIKETS